MSQIIDRVDERKLNPDVQDCVEWLQDDLHEVWKEYRSDPVHDVETFRGKLPSLRRRAEVLGLNFDAELEAANK